MTETAPKSCLICHEPTVDVRFESNSFLVDCLDCGSYEILELAAQQIQEYSHDDRQRLLDKARRESEGQEGPPLLRTPFTFA